MSTKVFRFGYIFILCSLILLVSAGLAVAETWTPFTELPGINTKFRDLDSYPTADGKTLYFSSDRLLGVAGFDYLDIWVSYNQNGFWTTPVVLPAPVNVSNSWEGAPSITLDGRYMYFQSWRSDTMGELDIYVSENRDGVWTTPVNLGPNINSSVRDCVPRISPDGQTLIFASDRPGGYGRSDLWYSKKVNGVWQPCVNFGDTINTPTVDDHAAISYSGKYLFFSSYNPSSRDVFRAEKVNGVWQTPVLVTPINTGRDDVVDFFLECDNSIYMSTMSGTGIWAIGTAQWLDPPYDNPCSKLIIPEGNWRVRVTLLEASAALQNDIYIDQPISDRLIKNSLKNIGTVVTTPFISAEELIFHIHVKADTMGLGTYDHYSNSEFAKVQRVDPLRYIVGFEDLPADRADWDYNDTVLLVELIGEEVNIWESYNYLGEPQIVEEAPLNQDTYLALNLTSQAGSAELTVPGAGLDEPTYATLIEGDTSLYEQVMDGAPFEPTGVMLKVELADGQAQVSGGENFYLGVDLEPPPPGIDDADTTAPILYHFNTDTLAWDEVSLQEQPYANRIDATTPDVGLYAVGYPLPEPVTPVDPVDPLDPAVPDPTKVVPQTSSSSSNDGSGPLCGVISLSGREGSNFIAYAVYLVPLMVLVMLRLKRRQRRENL